MRMMTGAIIVLAHVILLMIATFSVGTDVLSDKGINMLVIYSWLLGAAGYALIIWGLFMDFKPRRHPRRHHSHGGSADNTGSGGAV